MSSLLNTQAHTTTSFHLFQVGVSGDEYLEEGVVCEVCVGVHVMNRLRHLFSRSIA